MRSAPVRRPARERTRAEPERAEPVREAGERTRMDDRYVAKRVIYLWHVCHNDPVYDSGGIYQGTVSRRVDRPCYHQSGISGVVVLFIGALPDEAEHAENRETSYRRIFAGYLASLGVTAVCLVLPEFSRPVMLSAILMLGVGNIELSCAADSFSAACSVFCAVEPSRNSPCISCWF